MFDRKELSNCPYDFAMNCLHYEIGCHGCRGDGKGDRLLYKPISDNKDLSYKKHPSYDKPVIKKSERKSEKAAFYNRKGRDIEKRVIKGMGARPTMMSGATNGDSDGILIIGGYKHRISHKFRFNIRNCLGPTSSEWESGLKQGVDFWITSSDVRGSVVTMSIETFNQLKEMANGNGS